MGEQYLLMQKCAEFNAGLPKDWQNISRWERANLGKITAKGMFDLINDVEEKLRLFRPLESYSVVIMHSTSRWLGCEYFSQTAQETAELIALELCKKGIEPKLFPNYLLNCDYNYGYVPNFSFFDFLFKKYQDPKIVWEKFIKDEEEQERLIFGCESPLCMAEKMVSAIQDAKNVLKEQEKKENSLIWIIGHFSVIASYLYCKKIFSMEKILKYYEPANGSLILEPELLHFHGNTNFYPVCKVY